jgi:hypothetical protein
MSNLRCIVYTSSAVRLLGQDEIDYLLSRARQRNLEHEVTGLLLYWQGSFMQYIEGQRDQLMAIYKVILDDPLHHTIIELLNEPVGFRAFEGWAMAYSEAQTSELESILEADSKQPGDKPQRAGLTPGQQLLASFWRNHNRFPE